MGYTLIIPPAIMGELAKLEKRDKAMFERVKNKLAEIQESPLTIGRPKGFIFKNSRGVHIGPFVLLWATEQDKVSIVRFKHHDHVYKPFR